MKQHTDLTTEQRKQLAMMTACLYALRSHRPQAPRRYRAKRVSLDYHVTDAALLAAGDDIPY